MEQIFYSSFSDIDFADSISTFFIRLISAIFFGFLLSWIAYLTNLPRYRDLSILQAQTILTMVCAMVILIIGENIAWAIGFIGALSFIRFRTILKNSRDTAVFFTAAALGLGVGSGQIFLSFIAFLFSASILVFFRFVPGFQKESIYFKIYFRENPNLEPILFYLGEHKISYRVISFSMKKESAVILIDLSMEMSLNEIESMRFQFPFLSGIALYEELE